MDMTGNEFLKLLCLASVLFILIAVPLMQRSLDRKFGVKIDDSARIKTGARRLRKRQSRSKYKPDCHSQGQ